MQELPFRHLLVRFRIARLRIARLRIARLRIARLRIARLRIIIMVVELALLRVWELPEPLAQSRAWPPRPPSPRQWSFSSLRRLLPSRQ